MVPLRRGRWLGRRRSSSAVCSRPLVHPISISALPESQNPKHPPQNRALNPFFGTHTTNVAQTLSIRQPGTSVVF